ncbi:IS3 family transposase, partial [Thiobacter aerophilum]|uniref:IS3 family transposase n=1 Tax=Thiobacter aerophilum TaxID=3121275 RepID=UPI003D300DE1
MKKRFTEEQIIGFLREAEAGLPVKDLCRRHGFSEASYDLWRSKFGGMSVPDATRLKALEAENTRLGKLLAEQMFENDVIKDTLREKGVTAPARRALVRHLVRKGLSERRSLAVVRMSASAYRYAPRPDRNGELRARILALAQRHTGYGVGMIHLKLRQAGLCVNYKRVERLYREAKLHVRRRKRKQVLPGERQPLVRPSAANQVWSMDFVVDRTADGRVIKCLTIVDDATHEAVAIEVERAISGLGVGRVLDRLARSLGLPQVIRTDNGKAFCGKAMVAWAHAQGVQLRLIQPGKPNQNAYVESFNGRLRKQDLPTRFQTHLSLESRAPLRLMSHWKRLTTDTPLTCLIGFQPGGTQPSKIAA